MGYRAECLCSTKRLPQCQARRLWGYANDTSATDFQCTKRARYRVGGRYYCMRHAEIAALRMLENEIEGQGSLL
jgi:hypothetical protein